MAINITSSYSNPQMSILQKYHNVYKNNGDEKKIAPKSNPQENVQVVDIKQNEMRELLTVDEKRVLKEVFGDLDVDKKTMS